MKALPSETREATSTASAGSWERWEAARAAGAELCISVKAVIGCDRIQDLPSKTWEAASAVMAVMLATLLAATEAGETALAAAWSVGGAAAAGTATD